MDTTSSDGCIAKVEKYRPTATEQLKQLLNATNHAIHGLTLGAGGTMAYVQGFGFDSHC